MSISNYTRVVLLTDKYLDEGVSAGAVGYSIEINEDEYYEIEFSGRDGITTIAQIVVKQGEVAAADSSSRMNNRSQQNTNGRH